MGHLKCKSCGGIYELQPGESPGDFEGCHCGGKLEFYESGGQKRNYFPIIRQDAYHSSGSDMIRLLIVGGILLLGIFLALIMTMFLLMSTTTGGTIFSIIVLSIVLIINYSLLRVLLRTISRLKHN